jgi:glycosyltransferase involved in cell wall biosynthesis
MISIIIPTYNEERFLPRLLTSLASQNTKVSFEVIVVDGGSHDMTAAEAKKFAKKLPLRFVVAKKRGAAEQRNEGILQAKGDWLIFIDADNQIPSNFLEKFNALVQEQAFDIAIFKAKIQKHWPVRFKIMFKIIDTFFGFWKYIGVSVQHGGFIAINKSHLYDKFDTDVEVLEDYIFVYNNAKKGARFTYVEDPYFIMSLRRFKRDGFFLTLTKNSWHVISFMLFRKKFLQGVHYAMDGGTNYTSEHIEG